MKFIGGKGNYELQSLLTKGLSFPNDIVCDTNYLIVHNNIVATKIVTRNKKKKPSQALSSVKLDSEY